MNPPPAIAPVAVTSARPFWSVMIPAYNPRPDYLEQTLRGVLAQDPGPEQMQIEVVDDCSPNGKTVELVRQIAGDRVTVHCEPKNRGLAATWNLCIERARGEWVHILHQDDEVLPEFYAALGDGVRTDPKIGAAFCRHIFMDADGNWLFLSAIEQKQAGVIPDALARLAEYPRIQTPSIVVRRDIYTALGGFNSAFCYALDWEMWCRVAARHTIWYEPLPLAAYRSHSGSESTRLAGAGEDIADSLRCIDVNVSSLPKAVADRVRRHAREYIALLTLDNAWRMANHRQYGAAWRLIWRALSCRCSPRVFGKLAELGINALVRLLGRLARS